MTFDLSRISAKQKRATDWERFIKTELIDPATIQYTKRDLAEYRKVLLSCWEKGSVSEDDAARIEDLERALSDELDLTRAIFRNGQINGSFYPNRILNVDRSVGL